MTRDLSPSPWLIVRADLGVGVQILHSRKNTASHLSRSRRQREDKEA